MRNRFDVITGGHYRDEGYEYALYLAGPDIVYDITRDLKGNEHSIKKFCFNTGIVLTRSNRYVNITVLVLGIGFGLEIKSRS